MLRIALIGLWASVVTIASIVATSTFRARANAGDAHPPELHAEMRKTREISIPKIGNGAIDGYIVTQLMFAVAPTPVGGAQLEPDAFVVDEAFRMIYEDDSLNFKTAKKIDLKAYAENVRKNVNARLNADRVSEIAIQEFMYVPSADSRRRKEAPK